jgi:outer membrane protein assembly factor BamA
MAKYKVLVIAMTVKNNGIAKSGELIDESQLNSSAEELVKEGFIEKVESEVEVNDLEVKSEEVKPAVKKVVKSTVKK